MLIEGESGVGKELIARAIHGQGERRAKPFVAVNCGAIPDNLVESILFGHEKGAFTGATERHIGKFVEASGGTLFLDEVGELPPAAQVKLLRAIQEGEVEPVGARKPVKVDVRLISATNRNLIDDVKAAASARICSIACMCFRSRCRRCASGARTSPIWCAISSPGSPPRRASASARISGEALALLTRHRWPGNVRQLENAVFRAVVLAEGDSIGMDEFPQIAQQVAPADRQCRGASTPRSPRTPDAMFSRPLIELPPLIDIGTGARDGAAQPPTPAPSSCSTPTVTCGRWRKSRPKSSALPSPIIAARCRRSRAGCRSGDRRFTASSSISASPSGPSSAPRKSRPMRIEMARFVARWPFRSSNVNANA